MVLEQCCKIIITKKKLFLLDDGDFFLTLLTGCLLPTYIALHGAIFLLSPKYRAGRNRNKKQNEWFEKSGFIELSRHKKFRNFKILVDRVDSFWPVMFFYS